jgi:hypothetical protein
VRTMLSGDLPRRRVIQSLLQLRGWEVCRIDNAKCVFGLLCGVVLKRWRCELFPLRPGFFLSRCGYRNLRGMCGQSEPRLHR